MKRLYRFASLFFVVAFASASLAVANAPGCTVKSRSSAKAGAHAGASSESSAECGLSWDYKLSAFLVLLYMELRYRFERRYGNRKDDEKWGGSL